MTRCFKVMRLLELMREHLRDDERERGSCSIDVSPIEGEMLRIKATFPGGDVGLYLPAADIHVPEQEFFEKWIQPAMRPCLCGARQSAGALACGH